MKKFLLAVSVLALVGQGCLRFGTQTQIDLPLTPPDVGMEAEGEAMMEAEGEAMMEEDSDVMMEEGDKTDPAASNLKPYYIAYSADVAAEARAEGRVTMYYFWAAWCPICRAEEPKIKAWVEGSGLPVAGFRVNFDTEAALKAQFKIPYQHTTVILNAEGEETTRFSGPVTQTELLTALSAAAE